jgi:RHH-type proline utilization regulon transcriptional repressor/proline dehydrogenase/delta 1-pyrroline-5-carboxylate dehydrogenase
MGDDVSQRAAALAAQLLSASLAAQSSREHADSARLARMMNDPRGKAFTVQMVDQVFRSRVPRRQAARFRRLLKKFDAPAYLSPGQRWLLRLGALASRLLPALAMRGVAMRLRHDTARVILPAEPAPLRRYLETRRAQATGVIVNQLGEAVLGEREAAWRLDAILALLNNPLVPAVSVKLSSIDSQINLLDWEGALAALAERVRRLYRAALPLQKFVNLDMEEYRDLRLTLAVFEQVLDEPEFRSLRAGIVLQAYLPDAFEAQQRLSDWALARVAAGGAPIKLRLVKGANLAMESVEAEWHGWPLAPYPDKARTDANFCRMLDYGCDPSRAHAVNLAVGSHNLFDIGLALVLRETRGLGSLVELEMLEGMANHQARAVRQAAGAWTRTPPRTISFAILSAWLPKVNPGTASATDSCSVGKIGPSRPARRAAPSPFRGRRIIFRTRRTPIGRCRPIAARWPRPCPDGGPRTPPPANRPNWTPCWRR